MSDIRPTSRWPRRRISPLAVLTAAAALVTGLVIAGHSAHQQARTALPGPAVSPSSAAPGWRSSAAADPAASPSADLTGGQAAADASVNVRYFFDGGARQPALDSSARHPLRILTANGGTITYTRRADGWALQFPRRCRAAPSTCPRAIMQGARDDSLNPGTRALRYGATVLMTRTDTADGANVLQKGYSVGGSSQYKLQVDHAAGKPSCVVAGRATIYRAESAYTVADGRWHTLACLRAGNRLTLYVDGAARATRTVPATLSIANTEPLRIGGKGTTANNDQFAGQIDNVWVSIG
jgi:Concanavalin A-like lectin/glucanases superfamily